MDIFTNEFEEKENKPNTFPKKGKIAIIILSCFILVLILAIIILSILYIKEKNKNNSNSNSNPKKEEENQLEMITNFLRKAFSGDIYYNLTYAKETVENTFKNNGKNYQEKIGPINENKDYKANKYNIYDLYLPYSALKTNKTKGIILFIHGGAWIQGNKEEMAYLCQIYFEHEYIIANMDYTLLTEEDKSTNIYRILDDISACIEDIKNRLKNMGFNEKELEIAIGGGSAGGHLSLLYGYLVKEPPLPVKFIIDAIGPVNLETDDFYFIEKDEDTLPDIEPETVNEAIKKNKYNKPMVNDEFLLKFLNLFIGSHYTQVQLKGMLKQDNTIDKQNPNYKELFDKAKYGFPINWMEGKDIPILALYGGKDQLIGFIQYARLKETAVKYGNTLQLVYSRYGGHGLSEFEHEEGKIAAKDFHFYMLKFSEDYFNKH